jgi:hypothetical protein
MRPDGRASIAGGQGIRIAIVGNCQGQALARLFEAMNADVTATSFVPTSDNLLRLEAREHPFGQDLETSDVLLVQTTSWLRMNGTGTGRFAAAPGAIDPTNEVLRHIHAHRPDAPVTLFPNIFYSGFHPDFDFVRRTNGEKFNGPLVHHSSIAFFGWKHGLDPASTVDLFNDEVFEQLGFFSYTDAARAFLIEQGRSASFQLESLIDRWNERQPWMYTFSHPKLFVLADIARALLDRIGLPARVGAEHDVDDTFARQPVCPVYPGLAARLGFSGSYAFQPSRADGEPVRALSLEEFVRASFDACNAVSGDELVCQRLDSERYRALAATLNPRRAHASAPAGRGPQPYRGLPSHQFWDTAVAQPSASAVDPLVTPRFTLSRTDKVATAGSCFAQHIARALTASGFNYYVAERSDENVFSARYGNIYTARQLVQLFDRAYGRFVPHDRSWLRADGRYVDPFRPQIAPAGFASRGEVDRCRESHLAAVRRMFEELNVFVFTLGLTEAWRSRVDGAVYPVAPGVVAGAFDADRHEFVNFTVAEVTQDLQAFVDRLLGVNPGARMILTVSPVPLRATYEERHVLVATTYSKSVLRVAAEEIRVRNAMCEYFPSFEIITGPQARGAYFDEDLRTVRPAGVAHVMRLFLSHYASKPEPTYHPDDLASQNARLCAVLCDEEAISR